MKTNMFNEVIENQIKMCRDLLIIKGAEYATEDRLHNFKTAARMQECTIQQALAGMMAKHTVSIYDMCNSNKDYTMEYWDEKITDHINYLLLLKATLYEGDEIHEN